MDAWFDDDYSTNKEEEEVMDTWIDDEHSTRKDKMIADYIDYRKQEWFPTDIELMNFNEVTQEDLEVYGMKKNDLYDTTSFFEEIEKSKTRTGIETRLEINLNKVGLPKDLSKTPFNNLVDKIQRIKEVTNKEKKVKVSYPFLLSKLIDDFFFSWYKGKASFTGKAKHDHHHVSVQ